MKSRFRRRYDKWGRSFVIHERPKWWPEGESWPPDHRGWRRTQRRLFPRMVLGVVGALVFSTALCSGGILLVLAVLGNVDLPSTGAVIGLVGAGLLVTLVMGYAGRSLRRVVSPLDALLVASEKVAAGDYNVRVPERGAPEVRALAASFNEMVRRLRDQTEERQDLLADVTHELRTPLTVVQGNIEGMLDGVYPRDDEKLASLLEETTFLSNLIEDLRTLALAERSALLLRKEATDLEQLTSETMTSFRSQAESIGVMLDLKVQSDLPLVEVDPLRIRQVLTNLLTNALRFTTEGDRIDLALGLGSPDQVMIELRDSGTGISPEDLPKIFNRFYKLADSKGSGLGLAIAKQLVSAHGGEIQADSILGEGTRITITLPL